MNVVGIGIDAVDVGRFGKAADERGRKFLEKIFTERELEYADGKKASFEHMAGKFAAKEAVKKALPDGVRIGLNWANIEILNGEDGKPYVELHGEARRLMEQVDLADILISISHTGNIAMSNAMAVKNG